MTLFGGLFGGLLPPAGLDDNGLFASRRLPDGRWLTVQPLTFGRAQLAVTYAAHEDLTTALNGGPGELPGSFNGGYTEIWEYDRPADAIAAMEFFNGAPTGWTRKPV